MAWGLQLETSELFCRFPNSASGDIAILWGNEMVTQSDVLVYILMLVPAVMS
jgi:hypothetical protein